MLKTTLCYIEQNNRYLMLHRNKKKSDTNSGKWIGIGGKFEQNETPLECVLREAKEETGLSLLSVTFRGIVHFRNNFYPHEDMYLFTSDNFVGSLKACDEGTLEWVDKSRLSELALWEGDKIFLRELQNHNRFFELTLNYEKDTLISHSLNYPPA